MGAKSRSLKVAVRQAGLTNNRLVARQAQVRRFRSTLVTVVAVELRPRIRMVIDEMAIHADLCEVVAFSFTRPRR